MAEHLLWSRDHAETDAEILSLLARFYPATNPDKLSDKNIRNYRRVDRCSRRYAKIMSQNPEGDRPEMPQQKTRETRWPPATPGGRIMSAVRLRPHVRP